MKQPPRGNDLRTHAFTLLTQGILTWDAEYQSLSTDHSEYVGRLNAMSERIEALRSVLALDPATHEPSPVSRSWPFGGCRGEGAGQ